VAHRYHIAQHVSGCARRYARLVQLLLLRGAAVNTTNGWGWSALHFAAAGGSTSISWQLLQASRGTDVEQTTSGSAYAASALDIARLYKNDAVVAQLQYVLNLQRWARDGTG
jgi:ankyrin repeat protein